METQKINGIVLSVSKYKDFDALCSILTENGIKKVKFTGVRRPKAKFAYAAQPFCCGEFLLSSAKDYAVVMQVSQKNDFYTLANNYDAFVLGAQMLKTIQKIATNDTKDLLDLLLICLSSLQIDGIDILTIKNYFHTKILQNLGIWGNFSQCSVCGQELKSGAIINPETGAVFCKNCSNENGVAISSNLYEYLKLCANSTLSQLIVTQTTDGVKTRADELLTKIVNNQT